MKTSLRRAWSRLRALMTNGRLDVDFTDELQAHIDLLTEEHVKSGVEPAEARRLASVRVGCGWFIGPGVRERPLC